jgi:C4-dicarboxylate-specific signal transduction histidine kinase
MTIVRDVTKRHQSEEALHRAQAELAQATRLGALGELAASIAHEVNQPLSAIITNARACLRQLDASPVDVQVVRDVLHDVVSDGRRATDVISRIRGMVKQAPQHRGAVSVNDVIENVIALSRRLLRERRVHLHLTLADDLPMVAGDRVQLQQVLLNLVLNAADAMQATMPRARTLRIRSDRCPHGIVVSVADSGCGFSDDHLRQVFTPFFTTKPEGMGIGLSISRSIVEAHGGRLNLTQNSHNGATFELELPVAS